MEYKVLKKGDKFTASTVDEGEFTYYMTLAEFEGAEPSVISFKDGFPWVFNTCEIDSVKVVTETEVRVQPPTVAFKKGKKNG